MLKRSEVHVKDTWDLSMIFETEEVFESELDDYVEVVKTFIENYKGKLRKPKKIIRALDEYRLILQKGGLLGAYVQLNLSSDLNDPKNNDRRSLLVSKTSKLQSELSFVESELLKNDKEVLEKVISKSPQNDHYLTDLLKKKEQRLSDETEMTLEALSPVINATMPLYNKIKLSDMNFGEFEVWGQMFPLSFVLYENEYDYELDYDIRHGAYHQFSKVLSQYQHSTAFNYQTHIMNEKIMAELRGFDSTIDYLLDKQDVSRELYDRQIDTIMERLAPAMRKYAGLLQKRYGLETMKFNDLKLVIDPDFEPTITEEESRQHLLEGLQILGDDYLEMINKAFDERWIDFAVNQGKSTGAFCSSPYGTHPYILISWTSKMREVFVMAHELGHAGHFYNAHQHQNITDSRPSMYFIEAPSTFNELMMANHLLSKAQDNRMKRWIYSTMIARTYYHNFVTHLQEAHFQREVYTRLDKGQGISAQLLNSLYKKTLQDFWKDAVEIDDNAGYTWMRQQHYYKGLYPYTYSAGLTIATAMSKRVLEDPSAINDWREVLNAGGTKNPVELAAMAKVDITTDKPLNDTIDFIAFLVDEVERLTIEIENEQ